ncbi:acyl-CoA dehydrogenase family protein [Streptomyces sp. NPDC088789]|uniref:acyl-CoA dehydrogenase family protein n=1 Tax=Streptomyces sp. NPDC088789 TaxID=3365899 RepID=UPI003819823C
MPDLQELHAAPGAEAPEHDPHQDLRATVRAFAQSEIAPRIPHMEAADTIEDGLVTEMARMGWIGVTIPAGHGGMDAGHTAKTVLTEELSYVSAAMGAAVQASVLGTAMIDHFGTAEQKRTWLPAIADGSVLPTIAVTEEDSGGHVLSTASTGRRSKRHWVLTGRKVYVGNSHIGRLHGVVVRTGEGARGLTAFLVEADRDGVHLAPHTPRIGLRGFSFGELLLDSVRVPDSHRIGEVGDGLDVAYSSSVLYGRLNLAAVALGILAATHDQVTRYVRGRPRIARESVVRGRVGEIGVLLHLSRLAVHDAARRLDLGLPCDADLMAAKYQAVQAVLRATGLGMKTHGAAGLLADLPMERYRRDAHCIDPPAGTSDIQLHRLAEMALAPGARPQWSVRFARPRPDRTLTQQPGSGARQCPSHP